jgi:hypothetical protein
LEAEREASESALREAVDNNDRLIQENLELQQVIEDLNRRIEGIPEAVKTAIAKFLAVEAL